MERSVDEQAKLDQLTSKMALYQFNSCPFCIRVQHAIKQSALNIEFRNILDDPEHRDDLIAGGGKSQVPCLRIQHDDGSDTWLYESSDIVAYLDTLTH